MAKLQRRPTAINAVDIPPALAPLFELLLGAVMSRLRTADVRPGADRRVRHDRCALPRRAALSAIRAGELPAIKVGRFYFIEPEDLDAYYERHRQPSRATGAPANDAAPAGVEAAEGSVLDELDLEPVPEPKRAGARRGPR